MDVNKLSDAIGGIDEKFVSSALGCKPKRNKKRYIAANFLILFLGVCLNMTTLFRCGAGMEQDDSVEALKVIEHNGAYYEEVNTNDTKTLARFDLPYEITPEMLGENLGSLDYVNGEKAGILYVYEPYSHIKTADGRVCRSVYINESDGEYSYFLFCNYVMFDNNTHTEFTELLSVYGIDEWEDIDVISIGNDVYSREDNIKRLFDIFTSSYSMGFDDFEATIYKNTGEFDHTEVSSELSSTAKKIRIVSEEGVVIDNITYYPSVKYIEWALSYFRLEDEL